MEAIIVILTAIIVFLLTKKIFSSSAASQITVADLEKILNQKDKQFIDVRSAAEYRTNHIKQFKNIPLNELPAKMDKLNKNQEVVVICQSGMRSSQACRQLKKQGFSQVTNVRFGMNAWK